MRLTIGRKVLIGHLVMVGGLGAAALWFVGDLRRLDAAVNRAADAQEQVIRINILSEDIAAISQSRGILAISGITRGTGPVSDLDEMEDRVRARRAHRDSLLEAVRTSPFAASPVLSQSLDDLRTTIGDLDEVFDEVDRLIANTLLEEAELMFRRWHEPDEKVAETLRLLRTQAHADAQGLVAAASRFREQFLWRSGALLAGLVVVMAATAFLLSRSVRRSTRQISRALLAVADGNFDERVEIATRDEFAEVGEGLNATVEKLGELDALKAEFLSSVSHDLRTPIASIKQASQLLNDGIPSPLAEEQLEILQIIHSNAKRLGDLINDLLDAAKLEAGRLDIQPEPTDLAETIRRLVKSVTPLATERSLRVTMKAARDLPRVHADPVRLEQILMNLVGNAIKFTPEGGEITLSCWADDGMVMCAVRDTGVGIPPEDLPKVFDKFHQVRATRTRTTKGTGLGLTIVRYLVEAHGGRVGVESVLGEGTTFTFALPAAPADEPSPLNDMGTSERREI